MRIGDLVNPATSLPLRWFYPGLVWRIQAKEKILYLTFDDGPVAEITPWVLDQLNLFNAKATFFCVGENVKNNPGIFTMIKSSGHATGNHTYDHLNGWKTDVETYLDNVKKADAVIGSTLFRPPYGRAKKSQYRHLLSSYSIIMWDVLSYDFDRSITGEKCFQRITRMARPGSIIVMHDSEKAKPNIMYALPKVLAYFSERGFRFEALPGKS